MEERNLAVIVNYFGRKWARSVPLLGLIPTPIQYTHNSNGTWKAGQIKRANKRNIHIDLRGIAYYYESVGLALQRTLLVPLTITNWNNGTNTKMILKKYMPMATPWPALCPVSRQIQIRMSAQIIEHKKHKYTFACGCFVVGLPPSLLTARSNDPQPNCFSGEGGELKQNTNENKVKSDVYYASSCADNRPHLGFFLSFYVDSTGTSYSAG